jgi:hypothetical protein
MDSYATLDYYWPILVYGSIVMTMATALLIVGLIVLRRHGGRLLLIIMIVMLMAMLAVSTIRLKDSIILIRQRNTLAAELGVDLWSWPRPAAFPLGYFFSVLEEGMPRQKVHQIAKGYERVLRCGPDSRGFTQEVYYFYSDRDDKALRMQIEYDAQGDLYRVQGEDSNSRVFSVRNCQPGRWDE